MNLSQLALRYQSVVWLLVIGAMVFGAVSYVRLPAQEDPHITQRVAVVTTRLPGLSAEKVELLITKPLEEAIRGVPEVEEIRSTSRPGLSIIHAEVHERHFELDRIWTDLREQVADAESRLPTGTFPPQVNDDFGDVAVVTAALRGDGVPPGALYDHAQHIRDAIFAVPGTKRVDILGAQDERIFVKTSNARLAQLGIAPSTLMGVLRSQNTIQPGGAVDAGSRQFIIQPTGDFTSVEAIGDTLIPLPDQQGVIPLREVATVTRGTIDPPRQIAYYQGDPAIILSIAMLDGYSVLDYGAAVADKLDEIGQTLPVGVRLDIATFQADQVASAVYGVTTNVAQTLAIVLAVVILFLGVRTGLIVGAIVPAVMLVTLAIMGFAEMTLERMSLATLVIALGLLVDNGIVIAEDFKRRLEDGGSDDAAARDAALAQTGGELAFPLLSSTLTTILVFLPLMLAEHQAGEYTRNISLVVAITLLTSWVLAMTVTPLLCHRFIRVPAPHDAQADEACDGSESNQRGNLSDRLFSAMTGPYERLLGGLLRHRTAFLAVMAVLLVISVIGLAKSPKKFFPESDRPQILINVDLPAGSTIAATDTAVRAIMDTMAEPGRFEHIKDFAGYVGFGGPRFVLSLTPVDPAANRGFLVANVDTYEHVAPTISALRTALSAAAPEALVRIKSMFLGPSDSTILEVQAKGPDAGVVFAAADELMAIMATVPGTLDLRHDWENRIAKLHVDINQAQARRAGVTSADIADSMSRYSSGQTVTFYREGDERIPIVARAADAERHDLSRVESINVYSQATGQTVPLLQVAEVSLIDEYGVIARENLTRTATAEGRNTRMAAEDMLPLIQAELDALDASLPPGHYIEVDGVVAESAAGQAALAANVPLCVGLIVLLLVIQFNSYKRPAIILATIPLLLIGAMAGLYLLSVNFGFMIILGLYALAGILVNNAIVLIDRIDIERRDPETDAHEAIISASVRRLRPILMTTVTTILGLLPLIVLQDALFFGMATVIAFGLAVGTLLTLGVVPVLYSLVFRAEPASGRPPAATPASLTTEAP